MIKNYGLKESSREHFFSNDIKNIMLIRNASYIGGEWIYAKDNKSIPVYNPASEQCIGNVTSLSQDECANVISVAQNSFMAWAKLSPSERSQFLLEWYNLIITNKHDLAMVIVLEQGKPISEAIGEIDYAASFVKFYSEEAACPNEQTLNPHLTNATMNVYREPIGVSALITPWNFPSAMITRKAAAAMAAGCSIIIHPSCETPFSALALAVLAEKAGFPPGVFNVITGQAKEVVGTLMQDVRVRAISFTGSTEIGKLLYGQSAKTLKRMILELGGHAPYIVFDDADIEKAVEEAIKAKFETSGQDCLGANRFFIHKSKYDEFCEKFTLCAQKLTIGHGINDPDIGPLMNKKAILKQEIHVADALKKGARLLTGGKRHNAGSLFYEPTVLCDVPDNALIMSEETFGPVAAITSFETEEEVIHRANETEYGLIAYLHTDDEGRIGRLSRELEFGMIGVNRTHVTGAPIPFGGIKQSGVEREGSRLGMEAFMQVKYVCRNVG